jgi:hypothetical protein
LPNQPSSGPAALLGKDPRRAAFRQAPSRYPRPKTAKGPVLPPGLRWTNRFDD